MQESSVLELTRCECSLLIRSFLLHLALEQEEGIGKKKKVETGRRVLQDASRSLLSEVKDTGTEPFKDVLPITTLQLHWEAPSLKPQNLQEKNSLAHGSLRVHFPSAPLLEKHVPTSISEGPQTLRPKPTGIRGPTDLSTTRPPCCASRRDTAALCPKLQGESRK